MPNRNLADVETVKVLQITDLHILPSPDDTLAGVNTEQCFYEVLSLARQHHWPADLILFTGDLAQHPSRASYLRLLRAFNNLGLPCVCLPGNHDDTGLMS
ncbi:MAG: metallophosphoesterase, partial [Pseudomonadota bacterium]